MRKDNNNPADVLAALATLPPAELKQAQARIDVLLNGSSGSSALQAGQGTKPANSTKIAEDLRLVYDELAAVVQKRTGHKAPPIAVFMRGRWGNQFRSGAEAVLEYADQHLKPEGRRERIGAARLLLGVIARQLHRQGRPVTPGYMAIQMGRIGAVVNDAFPGYLAAGLLPVVLHPRRLTA
jgi:hypothetical protein